MISRILRPLALLGLLGSLSACTKQNVFSPKGPISDRINKLQIPVFITAGVVGVLVFAGLAFVLMTGRRRARDEGEPDPAQIHGNTKIELTWTILPFLILLIVAIPTVATVFKISHKPANAMKISVYGQQWWWSYEYDLNGDGKPEIITANELVLPVGRPVELDVQSRDVIHSFWIPALAGTRDAVPGRVQTLQMEASEAGTFDGQCKEFCGLSHANMRARAVALPQDQFDQWVADQQKNPATPAPGSLAAAGLDTFKTQCASCHQINGVNQVEGKAALVSGHAPNLTHLMSRSVFASAQFPLYITNADGQTVFNRDQLEAWLRNPPALLPMAPTEQRGMPNLHLSEIQIDQLIAYLQTLGPYPQGVVPPTQSGG